MSRSYKRYPVSTDGGAGGPKWSKRQANKKIRKTPHEYFDGVSNHSIKRFYESYDIHDDKWGNEECQSYEELLRIYIQEDIEDRLYWANLGLAHNYKCWEDPRVRAHKAYRK